MKRSLKLSLLLLCSLIIPACNNAKSSMDSQSNITDTSNSDSLVTESNESSDKKTTSPDMIHSVLLDYVDDLILPYPIEEAEVSIQQSNLGNDFLLLSYNDSNPDRTLKTYSLLLKGNDFSVREYTTSSPSYYIAQKLVSEEYILIIQYQKSNTGFTIYTYLYQYAYTSWPSDIVIDFLGDDIPHAIGTTYQTQKGNLEDGTEALYVGVFGTPENYGEEYKAIVEENGFTVTQNGSAYFSNDGIIEVDFQYDTQNGYFIIQIYKL